MADATFVCQACGKELSVDEALIGRDVACPTCAHVMTVPRVRSKLMVKGRQNAKRSQAAQADSVPENLSGLSDVHAFGDERETIILRKRRWAFAQQVLASHGILATLGVIGYGFWRFYDAHETKKQNNAEALIQMEEANNLRRTQRGEAKRLDQQALRQNSYWNLSEHECYRLWRALHELHPVQAQAQQRFNAWVARDIALYGLFSELFAQAQSPAAIEPACQRLAGMTMGLSPVPVELPPLDEFRRLIVAKLAVDD